MHNFVRNLITEWRRLELPVENATVVVAVSGGADSVSLLLGLNELRKASKLNLKIVAAHLNHQLRGVESDVDEQFVKHLTTELGIGLDLHREKIKPQGNLEQNARNTRYAFLAEAARNLNAFAVLTGHTLNDQAETFLLNLIRGSGPEGLGGMRAVRELESVKMRTQEDESSLLPFSSSPLFLVRPLLSWAKRIDTEAFCNEMGIEYRYDTMNEDTAFKRVQIRKILLPLLEDMNPKIVETLANTASLMQGVIEPSDSFNETLIEADLSLGELKTLSKPELYGKLRSWLRQHRGNSRRLELKHIQAIERLVFSEKSGKTAELPGGRVVKSGGKLMYKENKVEN
ncbi:MAG: tRNA lysidine(34) synthetase TilS [Chloracidobacterium sp.]|nr:tRNA lysidine(34) synthetase TilS [Chloracidobacterium sp.]